MSESDPLLPDQREAEIARRLEDLIGAGPAAFFRDACRLMRSDVLDSPLESTTHLVGHCLREVESALREVLEPVMEWGPEGPPKRQELSATWKIVATALRDLSGDLVDTTRSELLQEVERTLGSALNPGAVGDEIRTSRHDAQIVAALRGLGIAEDDPATTTWRSLPTGKASGLHERAHRSGLEAPRPVDESFRVFWADILDLLDRVLERLAARFLEIYRALDRLMTVQQPGKAHARELRRRAHHRILREYFFHRLDSPAWLQPLQREGFFAVPIPEVQEEVPSGATHWPQAVYLAKMARRPEMADLVTEILLSIETDNPNNHSLLLDAVLALPAEKSSQLVPKVRTWLESPHAHFRSERYGELIVRLTSGGRVAEALELAGAVVALDVDEERLKAARLESFFAPEVVRPRIPDWDYDQILRRHLPSLRRVAGIETVRLLADRFAEAALLVGGGRRSKSKWAREDVAFRYDDLESLPPYDDRQTTSLLAALRNAAVAEGSERPERLADLVVLFEDFRLELYNRLAMHLLAENPAAAPELAAARIVDRERFEAFTVEYQRLTRAAAGLLSPPQLAQLLSWIEAGPFPNADTEGSAISGFSVDEYRRILAHWRVERFALLSEVLPPEIRARHEALRAELEPPSASAEERSPPDVPITAELLEGLNDDLVTAILTSAQLSPKRAQQRLHAATDLARQDPGRIGRLVGRFSGIPPEIAVALAEGLGHALKQRRGIPWTEVLDLVRTTAERLANIRRSGDGEESEQPMMRELRTLANLLVEGLDPDQAPVAIPVELREKVWPVIEILLEDPSPSPAETAEDDSLDEENLTIITSVRTAGVRALIRYAEWVVRGRTVASMARDLSDAPEVRRVLDRLINPEQERSPVVRAQIGSYFPVLVGLDEAWAAGAAARIFPTDPELASLRDRAWRQYLHQTAFPPAYPLLASQYADAVEQLAPTTEEDESTAIELGDHLVRFYAVGVLEGNAAIVDQFFAGAPVTVRSQLVRQLGRAIRRSPLSEPVADRLLRLWDDRLRVARESPDSHRDEIASFGTWVASGRFPVVDAVERLREGLQIAGRVESDYFVLKYLAARVLEAPIAAVACVELILRDPDNAVWARSPDSPALVVFHRALRSGDSGRAAAEEAINRLAAPPYGYQDLQLLFSLPEVPGGDFEVEEDLNEE